MQVEPDLPYSEPKTFLATIHHPASGTTFADLPVGGEVKLLSDTYVLEHISLENLILKNARTGRESHFQVPEGVLKNE